MFRSFIAALLFLACTVSLHAQESEYKRVEAEMKELIAKAQELKKAGNIAGAKELMAEVERRQAEFRRRVQQQREDGAHGVAVRKQQQDVAHKLRGEIKRLAARGEVEKAEQLEERLHHLMREMEEREVAARRHDEDAQRHARRHEEAEEEEVAFERRLRHLHAAAENLMAAGLEKEADELHHRIEEMHRERGRGHEGGGEREIAELHHRVDELSKHVDRLTRHVEELTTVVKQLQQRGNK